MAYIKNIKIKHTVQTCINYITRPEKTQGGALISYGGTAPEFANMIWEGVRKKFGKDTQIKAHHFVQSFDPKHEITPEEAQRIGAEVAKEQFGKYGFEYILATHVDSSVIHNHILVNSVSSTTGKKYQHNNSRDFKKNPNSYIRLRQLNIDVCRKYGIPAVDMPKLDGMYVEENTDDITVVKKYSAAPNYTKTRAYDSWTERELTNKGKIRADIDEAIKASADWNAYLDVMKNKGYDIKWQTKDGEARKNVTYIMQGAQRGRRDDALNYKNKEGETTDRYSRAAIEKRIASARSKEKNVSVKTVKIQYRRIPIKGNLIFKGYYFAGSKYFCHPQYKIIRKNGRVRYLRRSFVETWFIKNFLKMPAELVRINGKYSSFGRLSPENEKKIREEADKTIRRCALISQYKIETVRDTEKIREQFAIHRQNLLRRIEEQKERIQENDRWSDLARMVEMLEPIGKIYDSLQDEKEKVDFYYKNKYQIQKLNFARRELARGNYKTGGISFIREERDRLYAEMGLLVKEREAYEEKISDMEKIMSELEGIRPEACREGKEKEGKGR